VTRTSSDLSRESLAFRLERLEQGNVAAPAAPEAPEPGSQGETGSDAAPEAPVTVELEQLQEAWRRTILPAVEARSIPIGKTLAEARPSSLAGDTLTVEFPTTREFHLRLAEDPKNTEMLRDALYQVTGRKLAVEFELGDSEGAPETHDDGPTSEEDLVELMKSTFDARELDQ